MLRLDLRLFVLLTAITRRFGRWLSLLECFRSLSSFSQRHSTREASMMHKLVRLGWR